MRLCTLLLFAGCGRIDFDPLDALRDAGADAPSDCWSLWQGGPPPLLAPEPLIPASDGRDHDPTVTDDQLSLYFGSTRSGSLGGDDVWVATRNSRTEPFGVAVRVDSIVTGFDEGPFFTRDGLTGVLTQERSGVSSELRRATRSALDQPFTLDDAPFVNINGANQEFDAYVSTDELRLYYSDTGILQQAVRASTSAPWSAGTPLPGLHTTGEFDVSLSPDELVIVFAREDALFRRAVMVAFRPSRDSDFSAPVSIPGLSSPSIQQYDPFVAPDGCAIYYATEQPIDFALYVARVDH